MVKSRDCRKLALNYWFHFHFCLAAGETRKSKRWSESKNIESKILKKPKRIHKNIIINSSKIFKVQKTIHGCLHFSKGQNDSLTKSPNKNKSFIF